MIRHAGNCVRAKYHLGQYMRGLIYGLSPHDYLNPYIEYVSICTDLPEPSLLNDKYQHIFAQHIFADLPEPLLLAYTKYECR